MLSSAWPPDVPRSGALGVCRVASSSRDRLAQVGPLSHEVADATAAWRWLTADPAEVSSRPSRADQAGLGRRLRLHMYGVVVVTFVNPDRCRIGREDSVESLCKMLHPRRRAERARSAVKAR